MIFLVIVQRCRCEVCGATWDLKPGEDPPKVCRNRKCQSGLWMWGPEGRRALWIRLGRTKNEKVLDKGASSLARQTRGKKQWRRFRSKAEEESKQKAIADSKQQAEN